MQFDAVNPFVWFLGPKVQPPLKLKIQNKYKTAPRLPLVAVAVTVAVTVAFIKGFVIFVSSLIVFSHTDTNGKLSKKSQIKNKVKNIILSLLILTSISVKCQNENKDKKQILIEELIKNSKSGVTMKLDSGSRMYTGYQICENQNLEIQELDKLLSNEDLDELFLSKNGALKCVAFIIFANRNNKKEILLKKLNEIFTENYLLIVPNCSDKTKTKNIFKFCAELLTYPNVFFKPTFNLSDKEKIQLFRDEFKYEEKMK